MHCSFGLQGELCLINHTACHGPMNQAAISSVSACICSTALPYPQAAAFTPFFCPFISPLSYVWLADMLQPLFLPPPALHQLHVQMGSVLWNWVWWTQSVNTLSFIMAKESPATVSIFGLIPTSALVNSQICVPDKSARTQLVACPAVWVLSA